MNYIIKKEVAETIKNKYKGQYIANQIGKSQAYLSLLLNRKIHCSEAIAFTFAKKLNEKHEIEDLFERV